MTTIDPADRGPLAAVARLQASELDLVVRQVAAIDSFNAARRGRETALAASARTREMRLDSARSLDVLRRQHAALVTRSHAQLEASGRQLAQWTRRRAVLAHRNAWFLGRVQAALLDAGVEVVAQTDNGADAVGILVAEQPDLVLLEDGLLMVPGEEVVRQARAFAPRALVAVQTGHTDGVDRLLEAGADAVFTRQVPPADVARSLLELFPT